MVVEGVNALPAAMQLARRYGVEMPIVAAVDAVVNGGADPAAISRALMTRDRKAEYVRPEAAGQAGIHRVLINGVFDRIGWRQVALLRHARSLGDALLVGLMTDECAAGQGLPAPVQSFEERRAVLETLRCVDLVIPHAGAAQTASDLHDYDVGTLAVTGRSSTELAHLDLDGIEVVYLSMEEQE